MQRQDIMILEDIPNVGRIIAQKLRLAGIDHPRDLVGRDPFEIFHGLQTQTGKKHDPCLLDVFISAVRFMEGAPGRPWWSYTRERKNMLQGRAGFVTGDGHE